MDSARFRPQNVAIKSFGCRTNQEEMVTLRTGLEDAGFLVVESLENADIVAVNTCSVTAGTEGKVRRLLQSISQKHPSALILVTGCLAEQDSQDLLAIPRVEWVVGNANKHEIVSILRQKTGGIFTSPLVSAPLTLPTTVAPPVEGRRTRFPVKIQEGCDNQCAYCIVPFLRGPSRSASAGDITGLSANAVAAGYKEIVLTGTHIGQYRDKAGGDLVSLVRAIAALEGDFRVRLSSLDPRELTDDLCDLVGSEPKVCDHLHVSLQSLSPAVLKRMARPYEFFDAMVGRLAGFRKKFPNAGIGADFIVGFPGEGEAEFSETIARAQTIGFSYAHIFRFSSRPGTAAALFRDTVPEKVKTQRSRRLRDVIEKSRNAFLERQSGERHHRIIAESAAPLRGTTSNYLLVECPSFSAFHNDWIDVIIEKQKLNGRFCRARISGSPDVKARGNDSDQGQQTGK